MTESPEPASLMDDADIETWWAPDADISGRLLAAIAVACVAVPALNARYNAERGRFEPLPTVDVGIAVETAAGVVVPVLADVVHKSVTEIRHRLDALKTMVVDAPVRPSVTLLNFGRGPSRYASLPLAPPLVAIVAAGQTLLRPVIEQGHVAYRHVLPLTLTYDTRACSLLHATRFLSALKTDLAKSELPLARGRYS